MTYGQVYTATMTILAATKWGAPRAIAAISGIFEHHSRVMYEGQWMTPASLVAKLQGRMAEHCTVYFWGGTPNNRRYVTGTVLEWLLDACFYEISINDPDKKMLQFISDISYDIQDVRVGAP